MTLKFTFFIAITLVTLSACTAKLLEPVQADADRVNDRYPGYTLIDLQAGKSNYEKNCARCHKLKTPESLSEEEWNQVVPVMAKKAKIDAQTEDSILKYLLTMKDANRKK